MTDTAHFEHRAERHRRLAELADNPTVRAAHEQLAAAYAARADDSPNPNPSEAVRS